MKKKLPVGIDDFKDIQENGYYFVDKSMLIHELLVYGNKVTLLPRPRRFGKTLNMSMIRYFFDIQNSVENRKLFEGLRIEKTSSMEHQGKYPVIYMSFKDIKSNSWEECSTRVMESIRGLYAQYSFILKKLSSTQQNLFNRIVKEESNIFDFATSFFNLSQMLETYYGEKVIILIDEYDSPLTTAFDRGYYDDAINFFRTLLSSSLKSNISLKFGVVTGILRIAKESIFSGLNNLAVSTILDNSYEYFGLTEPEVETLLKYYGLEYEMDDVKRWYNGYRFGKERVYNPWSIINFANNQDLKAYWVNTSDNLLIRNLLKKDEIRVREDLEKLFRGDSIDEIITENIIFEDINDIDTLWSLMLFSGYLTFENMKISEITGVRSYALRIPNMEVKTFFRNSFIKDYTHGNTSSFFSMMEDLYLGEMEKFTKKFKEIYVGVVSYHDRTNNEKYYHHFMLGLLLTLGDKYIITSNRESGEGRYDIALEPKDMKNYGLIFEFKVSEEPEKLEEQAQKALHQIEAKGYPRDLEHRGVRKIIEIGMAFSGKRVAIKSKKIDSIEID